MCTQTPNSHKSEHFELSEAKTARKVHIPYRTALYIRSLMDCANLGCSNPLGCVGIPFPWKIPIQWGNCSSFSSFSLFSPSSFLCHSLLNWRVSKNHSQDFICHESAEICNILHSNDVKTTLNGKPGTTLKESNSSKSAQP